MQKKESMVAIKKSARKNKKYSRTSTWSEQWGAKQEEEEADGFFTLFNINNLNKLML